ncbi:hypothetical protein L202_06131 [Cryptococcus amylolentus CBS 6039]|uniref:Uncharacterized protein n=2 Tax=Cryptococcus amylolentus TaxID=104669 RepID=A0A1E3HIM7_9TREE|nr:hypothetical protein L202_06131 [Cryptococcus amylolentus CBS 6039]ODN76210.1 hypothetical protein L202_06131 [Cryptococcus amylolentus CBS 6039]ODN96308.1 hypothetical protein I350_08330 [Cryptococcus amylolentus CBS 6273]
MPISRATSSTDKTQEARTFVALDLFRSYSEPPRTTYPLILHPTASTAPRLVLETPWTRSTIAAEDELAWLPGAWGSDLDPDEIFDMDMDFEESMFENDDEPELDPHLQHLGLGPRAEYLDLDLTPSHDMLVTPKFSNQLPVPLSPPLTSTTASSTYITPLRTSYPLPMVEHGNVKGKGFGDFRMEQEPESLEELDEEEEGEGRFEQMRASWASDASRASSFASSICSWAASAYSSSGSFGTLEQSDSPLSLASSLSSLRIQTGPIRTFPSPRQTRQSARSGSAASLASSLASLRNEAEDEMEGKEDVTSGLVKYALDSFSARPIRRTGAGVLTGAGYAFEGISPQTAGDFLPQGLPQKSAEKAEKAEPRIGTFFPGSRRPTMVTAQV